MAEQVADLVPDYAARWVSESVGRPVSFRAVDGGAMNLVYRVSSSEATYFLKITCNPELSQLRYVPNDFLSLMSQDRLALEVDAINMMSKILPAGMVPRIIAYDSTNRLLLMSDVAGPEGAALEDVFPQRINVGVTTTLAHTAAAIARMTNTSHTSSAARRRDESSARAAKLKYAYLFPCLSLTKDLPLLREEIRQFHRISTGTDTTLSHGDFHPRNVIVRTDDSVALIDFEESMLHDPAYDVSVLLASYILWSIRELPSVARFRRLAIHLLDEFRIATEDRVSGSEWRNFEYRINHYAAGAIMDRAVGINRPDWLRDAASRQKAHSVALGLLTASHEPSIELLHRLL